MEQFDFGKNWTELSLERNRLAARRDVLEAELSDVRAKLIHLNEILQHLAPLADIETSENIQGRGITDAIRIVLRSDPDKSFGPREIQRELNDRGYDLSDLTSPMASIYKILTRLHDNDEVERVKEDGRVFYKWKLQTPSPNDFPFDDEDEEEQPSSPITDEDIPF
jgi:hypothetical protein